MGSDFLLKISDIAQVFDGPHATPKKIDIGPYFLSISSLEDGQLDLSKSAHLSEEQFEKWTKRVTPQEGDVLFSYETRLGEAALMPKNVKACLGRRMGLLRPDRSKVLPEYLLYAYMAPAFQQEIKRRTIYGATVERISLRELPDFNIRIPDLTEQMQVVDILNALNGKIALNRQINQTLEQMAQTLFKSWFVDFDPVIDNALDAIANGQNIEIPESLAKPFEARKAVRESEGFEPLPADIRQLFPCEFEESELGFVPKGWGVKSMNEVTSLIIDHRGKTPKKLGSDWSEVGYPALSAKNIKDKAIVRLDTIRFVTDELYSKWMKNPLQPEDILMTSEAPLGELYYIAEKHDYLLSQRLYGIRAEKKLLSGSYLYYWLQTDIASSDLDGRATGTTVVGIRQSELKKVKVMCPSLECVNFFAENVSDYLLKIECNHQQNEKLAKLRDTLLPKLISGELRLDSP
ncbi:restriction endonuclease subunit S [Aliivibrio fischeri]|uniref:restriction endonuclease subunit S n=1 Tax=Aliivibrio fischeri TaxID=668 RepID=UPI00107EA1DF|nr:restriction endonuclease subunit S [Aliivibrio fischeri]TGA72232.1 restriction endonuclease subunit S [Aliivibrio fischeri]